MKTTKEKIEIMQAHEDGKEIEYQTLNAPWRIANTPFWDWFGCDYRITPPKKIKLYKWAIKDAYKNWYETERFFKNEHHLISVFDYITTVKRLDYTMIEVDEE